jgi:hypothetical protein
MRSFRRTAAGIRGRLTAPEAAVLRAVIQQVLELLEPASGEPDPLAALTGMTLPPAPETTSHPVLARLFPDAYPEDAAASEAFRVLAHGQLAAAKRDALQSMLASLPTEPDAVAVLRLDLESAQLWVTGLNDLRLALGTSIGVGPDWEESVAALPEGDPREFAVTVYARLTELQGSLVDALLRD